MSGWLFRPTCPCDPIAKGWVERRLRWLAEQFPESAFVSGPIILPSPDYFPDSYDGSEDALRRLVDKVCGYINVAPGHVNLVVDADIGTIPLVNEEGKDVPDAAGAYEESDEAFIVRIHESRLSDPMRLVGTIAHELAHVRLLGERRITGEEFDHEMLTDLTVIHFGLGIFLANCPRSWPSQYSFWPDSHLRKPEYMSLPMIGWALAHLAWWRREDRPRWAKYLSWPARANFKQALRYIRQTGDSTYTRPIL